MDGQDVSCGVKIKKREKAGEIGFNADDDEPIGVLLKLTKPRKNKKAKLGLDGSGVEGKKFEAGSEEKAVDGKEDDDLGCMEDTLASFRKKLKGPKKGGIGFSRIRSSSLASKELLEQSLSERLAVEAMDSTLLKEVVKKSGDDIDGCADDIVANKTKQKQKRRKVSHLKKHAEDTTVPHNVSEHVKVARDCNDLAFVSKDKVHGNKDVCLEDSLSSFIKKAQAGVVVSKLVKSSGLKLKGGKQAHLSGMRFRSVDAAGGLQSVTSESQNEENPYVYFSSAPNECDEAVNRTAGDTTCCAKDNVAIEYTLDPRGDIEVTGALANERRSDKDQKAIIELGMGEEDILVRHLSRNTNCLVHEIADIPSSLSIRLKEDKLVSNKAESGKYCTDISCEDKVDVTISTVGEEIEDPVLITKLSNKSSIGNIEGTPNMGLLLKSKRNESSKVGYYLSQGASKLADDQRLPSDTTGGLPVDDTASGASPLSTHPDDNGNGAEDTFSLPDTSKDRKPSAAQRPRKMKKHRHADMAYEGDVEWETLISGHSFLESHHLIDSDRPQRSRGKFDSSANGGTAAVSVGLKARAAGPVEKIKFKEILKCKGGLQEYLECRNWILSLWSNDMNHILSISDCGVADISSEDEPSRASLIREIYAFLDQNGYINTGVASTKPNAEANANQSTHTLSGETFEKPPAVPIAGLEMTSSVKEFENRPIINDENELEDTECKAFSITRKLEQIDDSDSKNIQGVSKVGHDFTDLILLDRPADMDISMNEGLANEFGDCRQEPIPELKDESCLTSRNSCSHKENSDKKRAIDSGKKIIVIGAGPAGLTATRHLQRQGFSVTVLEARSRIGGRVYTDHSSLSVPVDLGASIITGVEADMTSERRPDPSALVCAQLGVEMTLLNSDCPLYDVVTGKKVAADLDEALEAEYNSLLDDMVLVVAQNGEQAMKMSLEDGLEYALRRRRMARGGNDVGEALHSFVDSKSKVESEVGDDNSIREDVLSPLERRVMNWHFAHLEYGCAALLKEVSLPYWNQDDAFGGFGGAHCMIKGGFSSVVESIGKGIDIHLNHVVTDISYRTRDSEVAGDQFYRVKVSTSNGRDFVGDAVLITVPLGCLKAESIKFLPPLPQWKQSSIKRLGFGVLNKIVLEFPVAFWDDSVDYFGATAEQTDNRGQCFMFWNVRKTVGAPILIALLVGKAAIDGQDKSSHEHVNHAVIVLRKLFGEESVPNPVGSVVTDWGRDPFSYGAYSYVAIGASGEDYDILGKPVENCLFFAGEATCKEHPDTVGGAMMSGLREAVRIIDLVSTGKDLQAEIEALEVSQRQSDSERDEVRDITKRLDAVELSNYLYKNSLEGDQILSKESLLQDLFFTAKTTAGRLSVAKALLNLPVETLKSFAGNKEGLSTLNSWILDSMGKDGTQLLRHCVRLLVLVSTDLLAVRTSGIGKTVKEKVCVHTSRDIRAIASQLVSVWLEVFRKEKASNGRLNLLRQPSPIDSLRKSGKEPFSGKVPSRMLQGISDTKGNPQNSASGSHAHSGTNPKKTKSRPPKMINDSKSESNSSRSRGSIGRVDSRMEDEEKIAISEEEKAAFEAAEAARAAAIAAAEAYASSEAKSSMMLQLPKIPSFHKFARRDQYSQMEEFDLRRKWSGAVLGRQDCLSEIDSRNCRVRDWSVDFSAACVNVDNSSKKSVDNLSQRSHSNEVASHGNFRENSGESAAVDSSIFTKAWVDAAGSEGGKDHHAIERWQSQAAAAESDFFHQHMHVNDEEDSTWKHDRLANESSVSQVVENKEGKESQHKGSDRIKLAVVDYVASLLMPLYKARKIDRDGYKSIMKKTATKVMEQATDLEKAMSVSQFLDYKRRNKIRAFVDTLIERHMATKAKP